MVKIVGKSGTVIDVPPKLAKSLLRTHKARLAGDPAPPAEPPQEPETGTAGQQSPDLPGKNAGRPAHVEAAIKAGQADSEEDLQGITVEEIRGALAGEGKSIKELREEKAAS